MRWREAAVLAVVVAACGKAAPGSEMDAGPPVAFIDVLVALTASGCNEGGCHSPSSMPAGRLELVLAPHEQLVDRPSTGCDGRVLVVPFAPERSYLVQKLRGEPHCGERMPLGCDGTPARPCMKEERIALIEAWIRSGAPSE